MDRLDIRLMRQLTQGKLARGRNVGVLWGDIEPAYGEIGRILRVSRETVRARVNRLKSSGFLRTFPVQVNPGLFGLKMGALALDIPSATSKEEMLQRLSLLDGIHVVQSHIGTLMGVVFAYEDETVRAKRAELVSSICSATRAEFTPVPLPPCRIAPSKLDWQIVSALQQSAGKADGLISEKLRISQRTLRRRVRRMVEAWTIVGIISINVRALRGAYMVSLVLHYTPGEDRVRVDMNLMKDLDGYIGLPPSTWTNWSVYTLILQAISESSEILERVKAIHGVSRARIEVIEDRFETYEFLMKPVRQKMGLLENPQPEVIRR